MDRDALPPEDATDLEWLLHEQDSVLRVGQALRHMSESSLRHRLRSGRWQQPYRGVVVTHSGPLTDNQRIWSGLLSIAGPALLAGATAATQCGLRGFSAPVVHVLVPAARRVRRLGRVAGAPGAWPVVVHRSAALTSADVLSHRRPPHTTPARSLIDAAQWTADVRTAQALVAAGFQQRLVTADEIYDVLARLPRARHRGLITEAVRDASGGAHSIAELDFARLCRRHHLPEPDRQVPRRDARGKRRYLDVYWTAWHLHVEVDGGQHLDPRAWWDDMRRHNELSASGDRLLRFPSWAVRHRPTEVIHQLLIALKDQGWSP